jgi:hypothetical protein
MFHFTANKYIILVIKKWIVLFKKKNKRVAENGLFKIYKWNDISFIVSKKIKNWSNKKKLKKIEENNLSTCAEWNDCAIWWVGGLGP